MRIDIEITVKIIIFCIQGIEWKKVYSFNHPAYLGKKGFFANHEDAHNKNSDNETADMFSILDQIEEYRNCDGNFHFKICYPDLQENYSFPCNEWIQSLNPFNDKLLRGFKPINITFQSVTQDFNGLGMSARGRGDSFIDDSPFMTSDPERAFSIGSLRGKDGKFAGPPPYYVEKVELFINPGTIL